MSSDGGAEARLAGLQNGCSYGSFSRHRHATTVDFDMNGRIPQNNPGYSKQVSDASDCSEVSEVSEEVRSGMLQNSRR